MATELLTAALVLVTTYYAWQSHAMVREMRRARGVSIIPKMMLALHQLGVVTASYEYSTQDQERRLYRR